MRLVSGRGARTLLDYGCGDGTFIGFVVGRFAACVGADITPDQIADCRSRFAGIPNVTFRLVQDLSGPDDTGAYSIVTCMETLEHCTEPTVDEVLANLNRLCAPHGTVVISVPIETGPVFLVKYLVRKMAAWRGLTEYSQYETYSPRAALLMLFATGQTVVDRPVYGHPDAPYHSHYGFNWRRLRRQVANTLDIEATHFSPMPWSGGWLSSQVWFVCRPR